MPVILEPTKEFLPPYEGGDLKPFDFETEMELSGRTARVQLELGAELETDMENISAEKKLFREAVKNKNVKALNRQPTALMAYEFLKEYGKIAAWDVSEVRRAITTKLLALADCGDPKHELKALELLGKHSDVGLFTERSEVKITYENAKDLEDSIKEKLKRVLNATVIDVTPTKEKMDQELGVLDMEAINRQIREEREKMQVRLPAPEDDEK